ncbi:PP2C family serine/threonine-protein phosphatase [Kitasatospora sp. NPDC101155]|uniref:PP2C family serine/threonine-protein phosphatase n=1 Tax=Kitasatospora sp. NPDC101155 TaxID=3364097 RepID=UPI00382AA69E
MSTTSTVPVVRTGERAGQDNRPTEDRIVVLDHALVVLDGVSTVTDDQPRGGWYAGALGERIANLLTRTPRSDLREVLTAAIGGLARDHHLIPGRSPAATVAVARLANHQIDVAVLGDSPITAIHHDGTLLQLRDDRLAHLVDAQPQAALYRSRLRAGRGFDQQHREILRELRDFQNTQVNRPGGYWIAEAAPEAGQNAFVATWPAEGLTDLLLATDGITEAVDAYGLLTWQQVAALSRAVGPDAVIDTIRDFETQDPDARRHPRYKPSDDAALAHWLLAAPQPGCP